MTAWAKGWHDTLAVPPGDKRVICSAVVSTTGQSFHGLLVIPCGSSRPIPASWVESEALQILKQNSGTVQELCGSRGGRPGLSVLTSLLVSVDVKIY